MLEKEQDSRKLIAVAITGELGKGQPSELIRQTLQRASFCEMAAGHLHEDPTEQYLYGLLSLLPAVLGIPMPQIVELLPLPNPRQERAAGRVQRGLSLAKLFPQVPIGSMALPRLQWGFARGRPNA